MSGGSTPAERDQHILAVGHQCSSPTCHLVDFLPFKCQHCSQAFCEEHFLPTAHHCDKFDETKFNRVVPDCPLCNEPVAIPPGEDPNIRMERHFNVDCSVMTGRSGKSKAARCAKGKCGKVLIAPIKCDKCSQQFCPQHRFPSTHECSSPAPSAKPAAAKSTSGTQPTNSLRSTATQISKSGASAMASVKQSVAAAKSSSSVSARPDPSPTKSKPSTSMSNPFSKSDRSLATTPITTDTIPETSIMPEHTPKPTLSDIISSNNASASQCAPKSSFATRAREERESQRRAMQARARRGLLSEEEKVILASLEAEHSKGRVHGDKECIVM